MSAEIKNKLRYQLFNKHLMKKILILIGFLLFRLVIVAQNCTHEYVTNLPGKWTPGMKGEVNRSAADLAKEKGLMDDIVQTVRSSFAWVPVGGEIVYGNSYGSRGLDHRPLPVIRICHQYHPYIVFQRYFCGYGKVQLDDFIVEVNASINDLPFDFSKTFFRSKTDKSGNVIQEDPETDMYEYIENLPAEKNGMIEYTKTVFGASTGGDITTKYRILTKPGQLPYHILSKKENYEKRKIERYKNIEEYEDAKIKAAAQGTADKTFIELQDKKIAQEKTWIDKMDEILSSKNSEELAKPAFMGEDFGEYYEVGKANRSLNYIITPNLAYYNNQLPKSSPQVITIRYTYKCTTDKYGDKTYADEAFYNELERIKIMDLLTAKLQPLIAR
jgi:hypothetical protein